MKWNNFFCPGLVATGLLMTGIIGCSAVGDKPPLPGLMTSLDGASMVLIPAGNFLMGEEAAEGQTTTNVQHRVYLDAYYIDQFEVTTRLYHEFLKDRNRVEPEDWPEYWNEEVPLRHPMKPVVGVSWEDAQAFCLSYGKRLPTEAEWEKAARGMKGALYPWGGEAPDLRRANFTRCCDFREYDVLTAVGSFEEGRSPYGLYDMAGNVWEWVAGCLYEPSCLRSPVRNPPGPVTGDQKVIRGGSWGSPAEALRTSNRFGYYPENGDDYIGFRCVQDVHRDDPVPTG